MWLVYFFILFLLNIFFILTSLIFVEYIFSFNFFVFMGVNTDDTTFEALRLTVNIFRHLNR